MACALKSISTFLFKLKTKTKYQTTRTDLTSNKTNEETETQSIPLTHTCIMHVPPWYRLFNNMWRC